MKYRTNQPASVCNKPMHVYQRQEILTRYRCRNYPECRESVKFFINLCPTRKGHDQRCREVWRRDFQSIHSTGILNDPTMTTTKDLERHACHLADQYRAGLLPKVQSKAWQMVWKDLTRELRCRCPGFLELEYAIALNQGFVNSEQCQNLFEADDEAIDGIDMPRFAQRPDSTYI